jgi:hypothetical protein
MESPVRHATCGFSVAYTLSSSRGVLGQGSGRRKSSGDIFLALGSIRPCWIGSEQSRQTLMASKDSRNTINLSPVVVR